MTTKMGTLWIFSKFCMATLILTTFLVANSATANDDKIHIVAFGDSLIAGYGLPAGADFATRLEAALNKAGENVRITNAGVSGDTTSAGLARFDWAVPADTNAVILELGANDALRGVSPKIARTNLDKILSRLAKRNIPVLLAGMRAPANWGDAYKQQFDGMYAKLSKQYGTLLYPFFLDGVIDQPSLKLADALHPNRAGVGEMVRRILPIVRQLVGQVRERKK